MTDKTVAVLTGSLRRASFSRQLGTALAGLAPAGLTFEPVEMGALALYNQDFDDDNAPPLEWQDFRQTIRRCDALLFVTPEYNRSVPSVLKNAIDVGSRPWGKSVWKQKPAAVISITPGAMGGFGANHHLRQMLMCLDVPTLAGPEAYIGNAGTLFGDDGTVIVDSTRTFLTEFMARFGEWIHMTARP